MLPGGGQDPAVQSLQTLVVLPAREAPQEGIEGDRPPLDTHAGKALTAQIYGVLAEQTRFRFVPDLTVEGISVAGNGLQGARRLAEATEADGVLFATVYRFQDRVGPRLAASAPASVSFDLSLYSRAEDDVVWRASFDETQQPLSTNFLKAWMFWRGGPHWLTARELSRLGLERLFDQLGA